MANYLTQKVQELAINQALKYLEGNPEENLPKLMDMVDKISPDDWYAPQRKAMRNAIENKNNWHQLILKVYELDPEVRKVFAQNNFRNTYRGCQQKLVGFLVFFLCQKSNCKHRNKKQTNNIYI